MYVTSSLSRPQPLHRTIRITRDACGRGHLGRDSDKSTVETVWRHITPEVHLQSAFPLAPLTRIWYAVGRHTTGCRPLWQVQRTLGGRRCEAYSAAGGG